MAILQIPLLLKFGEKQHMENLLNSGHVFMQRIGHYNELEKDELQKDIKRADKFDGIYERRRPEKVIIKIGDHEIEGKAKFLDIRLDEIMNSYIYCMAGISIERLYEFKAGKIDRLIPMDLEKFGEYCTVITDITGFVDKFKNIFEVTHLNFIDYIDLEKTQGIIGPLKKDIAFKEQLEFRFIVKNEEGNKSPLQGGIGSLEGFTIETKHLEEGLTKGAVATIYYEGKEEQINLIDFLIKRHEGKFVGN